MMEPAGYTFFPTSIGECGIAWSTRAIVGLGLPEANPRLMRSRFARRYSGCAEQAPPEYVYRVRTAVVGHLGGNNRDLAAFPIDLEGVPDFERRVYEAARMIPAGSTMTYGDIATAIDAPGAAQAIGQALAANPIALLVPCHRVVAADGKIGGFSAGGGATTKRRILRIEGSEMGAAQETLFEA
jgi:methylated-DNA-[protein]-cysteine S-methyltransferase